MNRQGNELGLNGVTQRQRFQIVRTDGQVVGSGPWVTVDREGVPLVNNGLVPAPPAKTNTTALRRLMMHAADLERTSFNRFGISAPTKRTSLCF